MKVNKTIQLLLFSILLSCELQGQNINSELSKLFFNTDVTHLNPLLLDQFHRDTILHKTVPISDTVFYPLKSKGIKYFLSHTFTFNKNSYLETAFKEGVLGVNVGEDTENKEFTVLFIAFEFENQSGLDSAYKELLAKLGKLGEVEVNQNFAGNTAIITNYVFQKRVELMNVLFPQKDAEKFILYVYIKQEKDER